MLCVEIFGRDTLLNKLHLLYLMVTVNKLTIEYQLSPIERPASPRTQVGQSGVNFGKWKILFLIAIYLGPFVAFTY